MYIFKYRLPGQFFFRTRKVKSQFRNGNRLILELANGEYEEIPEIDKAALKYGQPLLDAIKETELELARKRAKDKADKEQAAKDIEKELTNNVDVSRVQG